MRHISKWILLICLFPVMAFAQTDVIWPNPNWVGIYGCAPRLNGDGLMVGDIIRAYDAQNVLCGIDTVKLGKTSDCWTKYGFMIIYGDDPWTVGDQGWGKNDTLTPGEALPQDCEYVVHFTINHKPVKETLKVRDMGQLTRIESFTSCCDIRGDLNNDGSVDLTDLAAMISAMTVNSSCSKAYIYNCPDVADMNGSGVVDITDLVTLVNYLVFKGPKLEPCH